jgi:hydrogenase-4 component E
MVPHAGAGALAQGLAHLPAAAVLALAFAALCRHRIAGLITVYAWQAAALAAAAAWQAWLRGSAELFVVAAIALGGKAILLPLALRQVTHPRIPARSLDPAPALGVFPSLGLGLALSGLAILAVPTVAAENGAPLREGFALALAALLLGLLLAATRSSAAAQAIGLLAAENGLALAAIGAAGLPFLPVLSLALLALLAATVFTVLPHSPFRAGADLPQERRDAAAP